MSSDLRSELKSRQMRVDAALRKLLDRLADEWPKAIFEAVEYSLMEAKCKQLRPILALMAAEVALGTQERALPAACAVEMVHTYSLIHDDLPAMDDDDLRRGLPTCHKKFGEALAILAGDALLTLAFQVLAESYPPAAAAVSCLELARGAGAAGMVGGQAAWIWPPRVRITNGGRPKTAADLESIHCRKTGALFRSSLRLGLYADPGRSARRADRRIEAAARCLWKSFRAGVPD